MKAIKNQDLVSCVYSIRNIVGDYLQVKIVGEKLSRIHMLVLGVILCLFSILTQYLRILLQELIFEKTFFVLNLHLWNPKHVYKCFNMFIIV